MSLKYPICEIVELDGKKYAVMSDYRLVLWPPDVSCAVEDRDPDDLDPPAWRLKWSGW